MRISFKTPPQQTDWGPMRDMWLAADDIDVYDAGWTFDHFYPIGAGDHTGPCFEGWTMLAVLAGLTRRIRLGVMVTGNPYRHPAVLANMAATLDVASNGRLELGIGAGWNEEESNAYGIDLPDLTERFDRLEEACAIIDSLLTRPTTTFAGRYYQMRDAYCQPQPVQKPRPPLVIGGGGERRTLRIAARWADQWNLAGGSVDVFRDKRAVLHRHCLEVGRDPATIEASVQIRVADAGSTAEEAARFVEAGAQHVILVWNSPFDPRDLEQVAQRLRGVITLEPRGASGD